MDGTLGRGGEVLEVHVEAGRGGGLGDGGDVEVGRAGTAAFAEGFLAAEEAGANGFEVGGGGGGV